MKYGVREICDVVLKAKADGTKFGNLTLAKGAPILYFDTLKTSSFEGTSTTVYAQGGSGNPRLVSWDGDRQTTFKFQDALISPQSFSILSGAGLMDASATAPVQVHMSEKLQVKSETVGESSQLCVDLSHLVTDNTDAKVYALFIDANGEISTSIAPVAIASSAISTSSSATYSRVVLTANTFISQTLSAGSYVLIDYYTKVTSNARQITIEADKFGGSYYLEAKTLFRDQANGKDYPAIFEIPSCRIQSNFTFTMASTGDPSTFDFNVDAFPDYGFFDKTKKVIANINIIEDSSFAI